MICENTELGLQYPISCGTIGCPNIGTDCEKCEYCNQVRDDIKSEMDSEIDKYLYR